MSEATRLRKIIEQLYESHITYFFNDDLTPNDKLEDAHERIVDALNASKAVPRECPHCGEAMTKLKTNWHCPGCGKAVAL